MLSAASGIFDRVSEGWTSGCDRLLPPGLGAGEERARQRRLLGLLFAAPFLAAIPLAQTVGVVSGTASALAAISALFGVGFGLALLLVTSGRRRVCELVAVAVGLFVFGLVLSVGGSPATPLMALGIALPIEAYRVSRSRTAALRIAPAVLLTGLAAASISPESLAAPSGWHWLAPACYLVILGIFGWAGGSPRSHGETQQGAALLERLPAVVLTFGANGEIAEVSQKARPLTGLDPALLRGQGFFDRVHVADRVAYLCALGSVRDSGAEAHVELRLRVPDAGGERPGGVHRLFKLDLMPSDGGGAIGLLRDAGEIEALRGAVTEALDRASEVEVAKGRFLASVSHELRTPLNAIIGFSEMLLQPGISGELSERQGEHVALIRQAGEHLLSVVNAILDVSKIESGTYRITPEAFDPQAAVALCCAMLEPQAHEKGVHLDWQSAALPAELVADQRAVQQILLNLISNAVKFTPDGGKVRVSVGRREDLVVLRVADTGIGIAADDLERLGKPFMQVHNDYTRHFQGTGLGLSLVKGLVQLHGGAMRIESAPGLGTTVTVELPTNGKEGADPQHGVAAGEVGAQGDRDGTMEKERHGATLLKTA